MKGPELEELIMDELMDGEATIGDLSEELRLSAGTVSRILMYLMSLGLVDSRSTVSLYGHPEIRYFMKRTTRQAA